jgi:hypothetical protein
MHVANVCCNMSQNPQKRTKDSKEAAEETIEQPIGNEDPTTTESLESSSTGK